MNDQQLKCLELGNFFEFMPGSDQTQNQLELAPLFLKHPIKDSVTFFGGSFNPFHQGHRACLDLCPEKNILIVPDRNPFKPQSDSLHVYDDFQKMAESLKDTPYSLYPGFLGLNETNPTSSWLPNVRIAEKNFLMGDDSFMSLLKWKNPEIVISSLKKLYVVPREFTSKEYLQQEKNILKINPNLEIHFLGAHPYMNLSSSKIKAKNS